MSPNEKTGYRDPGRSVQDRVADLLGRMTLAEKIQQMGMMDCVKDAAAGGLSAAHLAELLGDAGIGAVQDARRAPSPAAAARTINAVQEHLVKRTRLGIPALVVSECLHGHMSIGATVFPQAIGLASAWNTELMERITTVVAREARAVGVSQALAPDLDLARDPRWGRVEETYGEDPHLCGRLAVAYIRGLQGAGPEVDGEHLVATVKHFAAHGSPESGVNLAPVPVGPRELRELYLVPFKAGVVEAGALSVMPAYSEFDGVPCSASKLLLTTILREEWGFEGYTFADYGAVIMLQSMHRAAATFQEAGRQALEAGMDLEAPGICCFGKELQDLVERGEVGMDLIDQAVRRILRVKFLAGLFESPFVVPERAAEIVNCRAHRELALEAARESAILLKNEGRLLPLDPGIESIAVIGPNADAVQFGDYSMVKDDAVTLLQGVRQAVASGTKVSYARGCGIFELSKDGLDEAVAAVRQSQVAVVVVGGSSMVSCGVGWGTDDPNESNATCGEGFDRTELGLPGVQQDLVEAVVATGVPTVVVLVHGRPYGIEWIAEHVPAILDAWYPGEAGGAALADILFGKVNPSGRLPVSVPRCVGQVPAFYNHKPSARGHYHRPGRPGRPGRDYVFMPPTPLFEFGHGLSYTTFAYSNLSVCPGEIALDGQVTVRVDVENAGARAGKETVQLYVNDVVSSVTTPVKALKGFLKIALDPGQKETVEFALTSDDLALLNQDMQRVVEPGAFEVMIGGLTAEFQVRS